MANRDNAFGFVPITPDAAVHEYTVTTGQTIYKGDPVYIVTAGTLTVVAAGQTTTHIGIAAEYVDDSASAGGKKIMVYDDLATTEFIVQVMTGVTLTQADVFGTSDIDTYAAGSSVTKQSICEITDPAASSKPWIILRLYDAPDNIWGEHCKVVVKYNTYVGAAVYAGLS